MPSDESDSEDEDKTIVPIEPISFVNVAKKIIGLGALAVIYFSFAYPVLI